MRIAIACLLLAVSMQCQAQATYVNDLIDASGQLGALRARIDRAKQDDFDERMEIKRGLALLKRNLYRLSEEAQGNRIALLQAFKPVDQNTTLAVSAIAALILSGDLLGALLDTGSPVFAQQAQAATSIARALQQEMQ